jgi:hypothetical protein
LRFRVVQLAASLVRPINICSSGISTGAAGIFQRDNQRSRAIDVASIAMQNDRCARPLHESYVGISALFTSPCKKNILYHTLPALPHSSDTTIVRPSGSIAYLGSSDEAEQQETHQHPLMAVRRGRLTKTPHPEFQSSFERRFRVARQSLPRILLVAGTIHVDHRSRSGRAGCLRGYYVWSSCLQLTLPSERLDCTQRDTDRSIARLGSAEVSRMKRVADQSLRMKSWMKRAPLRPVQSPCLPWLQV